MFEGLCFAQQSRNEEMDMFRIFGFLKESDFWWVPEVYENFKPQPHKMFKDTQIIWVNLTILWGWGLKLVSAIFLSSFKIFLGSISKAMADREKKRGRQKYNYLNISRTKRAF